MSAKIVTMEDLVRELRKKEFYATKYTYAHERVWEDEEDEQAREEFNKEKKLKWDAETEEMIKSCTSTS